MGLVPVHQRDLVPLRREKLASPANALHRDYPFKAGVLFPLMHGTPRDEKGL